MNSERVGSAAYPAADKNEKKLRTLLTNLILTEIVLFTAAWFSEPAASVAGERPANLTDVFSAFVEVTGPYRPITQHVIPYLFGARHYDAELIALLALALMSFTAMSAFLEKRYWFTCVLFVTGLLCHEFTAAVPFLLLVMIGVSRKSNVDGTRFARNTIPLLIVLVAYSAFRYEHAAQSQNVFQPRRATSLIEEISFTLAKTPHVSVQTDGAGTHPTTGYAVIEGISENFSAEVIVRYGPSPAQQVSIPAGLPARSGRIVAAYGPDVRTSVAIANPNPAGTTIVSSRGTTVIPPLSQLAVFLDEQPFTSKPFNGRFEFRSTLPVAFAALSLVIEDGQTRMRLLPVKLDEEPGASSPRLVFPHFVFGGGYSSRFVIRSKNSGVGTAGVLRFVNPSGRPLKVPAHCYGC